MWYVGSVVGAQQCETKSGGITCIGGTRVERIFTITDDCLVIYGGLELGDG